MAAVDGVDERLKKKKSLKVPAFQKGDGVSVSAKIFDGDKPGSFSRENPERQLGVIRRVWLDKDIVEIEW
jgi:hypothetical protein